MKLSREPIVWRNALAGVAAAAASVGIINLDQEANVNGVVQTIIAAAAFLFPLIAAWWARRHTRPLSDDNGTPFDPIR